MNAVERLIEKLAALVFGVFSGWVLFSEIDLAGAIALNCLGGSVLTAGVRPPPCGKDKAEADV